MKAAAYPQLGARGHAIDLLVLLVHLPRLVPRVRIVVFAHLCGEDLG